MSYIVLTIVALVIGFVGGVTVAVRVFRGWEGDLDGKSETLDRLEKVLFQYHDAIDGTRETMKCERAHLGKLRDEVYGALVGRVMRHGRRVPGARA